MTSHDPEIEQLRATVNCAALLERLPPPWRFDRRQSTPHCLKFRRENGEILIVSHQGRGWWDPRSDAKGDVFDLVQHLSPCLNFGQARKCRRLQSSDAVLAISASILLTISETGIREMLTIFDPVLAIIAACSQSSAPAHAICN